ncbi:MAG: DUF1533 domain-containing protein [Verrucomicrobiota bacterium]
MKIKTLVSLAASLLALLPVARAQSTLGAWTFDNDGIATNNSPAPSTGTGTSSVLGMINSYNNTNSIAYADVQSKSGSSSGGPDCWRIRGGSLAGGGGSPDGWSTNAPIGTQGAQFKVSTAGYYRIEVSFDVNCTSAGEGNLQLEYTIDGTNWVNATITSVGTLATIMSNSTSSNTVIGSYVKLASSGTGWNNQIKADLSEIVGANNNTNFALRLVNASTGSDCINSTGGIYNNSSGNWSFDNVVVSGYAVLPITGWTFENYSNVAVLTDPVIPNPVPTTGAGIASALGFTTTFTFADGSDGSTSAPDCLIQAGSSSGAAGPTAWRVRGQDPGNGWDSQSDIGTQGAEFDVSTVNYTTILATFDLYFTSQGEAKMEVEYTTDGADWTNAATLEYPANPTFIQTNPPVLLGGSPNTVAGTYFYQTNGQNWYNTITVDLTAVPGATNNPNFGLRVVNAATGPDCVNFTGGPYNNSSGNWRFDNVVVSGAYSGPSAPTLAVAAHATVDFPFTNTFAPNASWQYNLTNISIGGVTLPPAAYNTNIPGEIIFTPSASALLQSSGIKTIVFQALNFVADPLIQPVGPGVATQIALLAQPAGPSGDGGTLIAQPSVAVVDQYGNGTTNPYPNVSFTATASPGWTLGGAIEQVATNGVASFTNLSATVNGSTADASSVITFTAVGTSLAVTATNSTNFVIGAPATPFSPGNLAALQIDTIAPNTTFSILELNPSEANQRVPANIIPISATDGTNSLRLSSSGSTGRLAVSDDGTLLCFAGFLDGSSLTPDETFILTRAAGTLDYTDAFTAPIQYSVTVGSSQARAACTVDDVNFIIADKNGVFIDTFNWAPDNTRAVKSFDGTNYLMSATSPKPAVYAMSSSDPTATAVILPGILTDTKAQDFYMLASGNTTNLIDTLYILDQVSTTAGVINKYSCVGGTWNPNGTFTTTNGGDGLFAATNGNGAVYLYYTTGGGGTPGNSIVQLTDSGGFNNPITITATNTIYTAGATVSLKGLAPVPQATAYAGQPVPPPTLYAAGGVTAGSSFSITLSPENPAWRAAITSITVNGSVLPPAAYGTTQAGAILFNAAQSALLQAPGLKTIVISASGYAADAVLQNLGTLPSLILGGVSLSNGQLAFSFTNTTGLSFSVLGTNDLIAPPATWPVVGTAVENPAGSGIYQFTDPSPATNSSRFYLLRQP